MADDELGPRQPRRPTPRWQKVLGVALSVGLLVVIVVGVIPQFASYSSAWARVTRLGTGTWVAIAVAAAVNQISAIWPYQAAMPGLRFGPGLLQVETATAIANTAPVGGAVAIGMTYKMFASFGFSDVVISTAVLTTGVWNFGAKFLLPVLAVALLAVTAHPTPQVVGAAVTGGVALVVCAVAVWLVFRSEVGAHWVGHLADRVVNWVLHFFHKPASDRIERSLLHFASQTVHTVRHRGWLLTWATLGNQVAGFVLVLIIVRAVGISGGQVTIPAVFTAFAVARLAGAVPITPGGLGTMDAAFISMMATFGASKSQALTADVVWRMATYLLPILAGIVTYLTWFRWRDQATVRTAAPEGTAATAWDGPKP